MKYVLFGLWLGMLFSSVVFAAGIQNTMQEWELKNGIDGSSIAQWQYIPTALSILSGACVLNDSMMIQVNQNVQNALLEIGLALNKDSAPEYYEVYQQRHDAALTSRNTVEYCAYKIAAYQLQQRFYGVYQGTAKALNPVRSSYPYRVKFFTALKNLNQYQVPESIKPYLKISVSNRWEVLAMPLITRKVAAEVSNLYQGIIGESLEKLKNDGILTQKDIEIIGSNIYFTYVQQCDNVRGVTNVTMSRTSDGQLINGRLSSIRFNVNVCEDVSYLTRFDQHVKDLIYHELAHYIYYVTDATDETFDDLCRWETSCDRSDYVSDYAMTTAAEDYAETFQAWYQRKITPSRASVLGQKFNYFSTLFGKRA